MIHTYVKKRNRRNSLPSLVKSDLCHSTMVLCSILHVLKEVVITVCPIQMGVHVKKHHPDKEENKVQIDCHM